MMCPGEIINSNFTQHCVASVLISLQVKDTNMCHGKKFPLLNLKSDTGFVLDLRQIRVSVQPLFSCTCSCV